MATNNDNYRNDLVNLLVNTWMARNVVFYEETSNEEKDMPDNRIMRSSWEMRWDFLDLHFRRLCYSNNDETPQMNLISDGVHKIMNKWRCQLCGMITEPRRYYHTRMHLEEMFGYMDIFLANRYTVLQAEQQINNKDLSSEANVDNAKATMILSIVFHDAVYDPKSTTNEEDSAALYRTFAFELSHAITGVTTTSSSIVSLASSMSLYFDHDRVEQYILATKHHTIASADDNDDICLKLLLDADMAVLGKHESAYDIYAGLIREEYIHVGRSDYCNKRAQVLSSFLHKTKTIFASQIMKDAFEVQSKRNLTREIELLSRGIIPGEIAPSHDTGAIKIV